MANKSTTLALAFGAGLAIFIATKARAKAPDALPSQTDIVAPKKLSEHFDLSEFVNQHKDLLSWHWTPAQYTNTQRLVTDILEPTRKKYGAIHINSGLRPKDWRDSSGKSIDEILKDEGYSPDPDSDHDYGGAADISLSDVASYPAAVMDIARNPSTRRVYINYRTVNGAKTPTHIHVAVIMPDRPRLAAANYAYVVLDGKKLADLNYA